LSPLFTISSEIHYRLSDWRAFACWQPWQLHVSPQRHASPHWHEAAGMGTGFWQPHVHSEPVQTVQAQTFD
jgi:hypothetical protein